MMSLKTPLLLDGATGTQLQKYGMPAGSCTEDWAQKHPDAVITMQRAYAEAGSDIVYAPTFGANRHSMKRHGIDADIGRLNASLVELTRTATDGKCLVGGDIAPCGMQAFPMGTDCFEDMYGVYLEQAQALSDAGVDMFAIETQMSLIEARACVMAVRKVSDKPVFVSFTLTPAGTGIFGTDILSALITLQDMGIDAFGINCVGDFDLIDAVLKRLKPYANIPLIVKPNAGMPDMSGGTPKYDLPPEAIARRVPEFFENGASIFGGCCGTDETHIRAMRGVIDNLPAATEGYAEKTLVCASERRVVELDERVTVSDIAVDKDFEDKAGELADEGIQLLRVELSSQEDVEIIDSCQHAVMQPLAVSCSDGELLARFLRLYNGKPVIL